MKRMIVLTIFVSILFSGSLVMARSNGVGHHGMGFGYENNGTATSNLNLTKDQSTKLQALKGDYRKEITPLQNQMISQRSLMRVLWNTDSPDKDKILATQKEISKIHNQMEEKSTVYKLNFLAMLTPEQQAEMSYGMHGMSQGHGGGSHHGGRL